MTTAKAPEGEGSVAGGAGRQDQALKAEKEGNEWSCLLPGKENRKLQRAGGEPVTGSHDSNHWYPNIKK